MYSTLKNIVVGGLLSIALAASLVVTAGTAEADEKDDERKAL
jgi:hypothetical protein